MARKGGKDRGLFLRGKSWYIRYVDASGKERKERAGATKTAAQTLYQTRKAEAASGVLFQPKRGCVTVAEAIDRYMATNRSKDPMKADHWHAKRFRERWGSVRVDQLRPHDIEMFVQERLKTVRPGMVNRDLGFLKRVCNKATRDGVASTNPMASVKKLKVAEGRTRWLHPDEEARLKKSLPRRFWAFVLFAIHTGLRQAEQFSLLWRDVDLEKGILTVVDSKASKTRHVPLNRKIKKALAAMRRTGERVFPVHARHWVHAHFKPALLAADIHHFRWHDLRHTFGSRLAQRGVPIPVIKDLMGHASIQMTMRYAHLSPDHMRDAVEVLAGPPQKSEHPLKCPHCNRTIEPF